jgi:hypothetical protein
MNNKITAGSALKIGEQETGSYLQLLLFRAAEKNNGVITKNLKQFGPWFKEQGARLEYNQLDKGETQSVIRSVRENGIDISDSISKILSTTEDDEEVWMEVEYNREHKNSEDIYSKKMMQDKSIEPLGNELFGLVTQEKWPITSGFNHLRE